MSKAAYDIVIRNEREMVINGVETIAPQLDKSGFTKRIAKYANAMTSASAIGKFKQGVVGKVHSLLYADFQRATAQSGLKAHKFAKSLSEMVAGMNLTHKELSRVGMFGSIFSTETNPDFKQAWQKEVLANAQSTYDSALSKQRAKAKDTYTQRLDTKQIDTEVEVAKDLLDKVKKGVDMKTILSDKENKVYKYIQDFAKQYEPDFFRNAETVWGAKPPHIYNYFPKMAQGKVGTTDMKDPRQDAILYSGADSLFDALSPDEGFKKYAEVYGKKVWSSHARNKGAEGYYYEYDAVAIASKWSKTLLFDIYASTPIKIMNQALSDQRTQEALGAKLQGAIVHQYRSAADSGVQYDPNLGYYTRKLLSFRDSVYMATLATSTQFALQMSSGIVAATVLSANLNPLTATANLAKAVRAASSSTFLEQSKFLKLLEERGLGIQMRDIGFEKYLHQDDFKSWTAVKWNTARTTMENWSDWSIRNGDKLAARLVWFAAYYDKGGTLDNPTKEAVEHAERMVGLLQNMSEARWVAPFFKAKGNTAQKLLIGIFYAYKSFSLNAYLATMASIKNFNNKEARMVAATQLGSFAAYHAMSVMLIKPIWDSIYGALAGDDDDEEEEEKRFTVADEILQKTLWDLAFGAWAPGGLDAILRWGYVNAHVKPGLEEKFDPYLDTPIFAPQDVKDWPNSALGPGAKEIGDIASHIVEGYALYRAQKALEEQGEEMEDYGFTARQLLLNTQADIYGGVGIIPFRGDLRRILKGIANKEKRTHMNEKSKTGGRMEFGTDIEGGSTIDPEYLFDDVSSSTENELNLENN
jgi:hypothetical protein